MYSALSQLKLIFRRLPISYSTSANRRILCSAAANSLAKPNFLLEAANIQHKIMEASTIYGIEIMCVVSTAYAPFTKIIHPPRIWTLQYNDFLLEFRSIALERRCSRNMHPEIIDIWNWIFSKLGLQ